jgi:hypothetical protein
MFDPDRVLTACMPLLPIAGSLYLLYHFLLCAEAWLSNLISENKVMKKQLDAATSEKVRKLEEEIEKLKQSLGPRRTVRGQSPRRRG